MEQVLKNSHLYLELISTKIIIQKIIFQFYYLQGMRSNIPYLIWSKIILKMVCFVLGSLCVKQEAY